MVRGAAKEQARYADAAATHLGHNNRRKSSQSRARFSAILTLLLLPLREKAQKKAAGAKGGESQLKHRAAGLQIVCPACKVSTCQAHHKPVPRSTDRCHAQRHCMRLPYHEGR